MFRAESLDCHPLLERCHSCSGTRLGMSTTDIGLALSECSISPELGKGRK